MANAKAMTRSHLKGPSSHRFNVSVPSVLEHMRALRTVFRRPVWRSIGARERVMTLTGLLKMKLRPQQTPPAWSA